jgi:phage-related protein
MAGPSVAVRVTADTSAAGKAMTDVAATGSSAASKLHSAFGSALAALNTTGVLGPFGAALDGINTAIGKIAEHGASIGSTMLGVGTAMAGVGAGLSALGSKDQAAHQQLQAAVAATGQSYDDYASRVDAAIKHQEKFGDSSSQTQDALAKLTEVTHDPAKALDLLSTATDVAAAKHESLVAAAGDVGKAQEGNTKILKTFGITVDKTTGLTADHKTAMQALADVTKGQASAAADTFTGKMDAVKTKLEDTAASMGQKYGPAITAAGGIMAGFGAAIDVATAAREALTGADWASVPAELASMAPILLIVGGIALLGVAIYELVTHWSAVWGAMKDAAKAVWDWIVNNWPYLVGILMGPFGIAAALIFKHWSDVKGWVLDAYNYIVGIWNGLVGFFTGLPARMAGIFSHMWDGIKEAFRAVLNGVIDLWNSLHFTLPKIDLGPLGKIGGGDIGVPSIPHLAEGGLITQTGLIFAHAGEAITPAGKAPGPAVHIQNATFNSAVDVDMLSKRLEFAVNAGVHV